MLNNELRILVKLAWNAFFTGGVPCSREKINNLLFACENLFTDFDSQGVSGVFPIQADVHSIVAVLNHVSGRAAA